MENEQRDNLNATLIFVIGIASAILIFDLIVAAQALTYTLQTRQDERQVVGQPIKEKANYLNDQRDLLLGYGIVDPDKKRVRIPIKRAMSLYAEQQTRPEKGSDQ